MRLSCKKVQVYVLKNAPIVEDIHVDAKSKTPVLNFMVSDPDKTFVSGKVIMSSIIEKTLKINLYRTIQNSELKNTGDLLNSTISKSGLNSFEVPKLKEGMSYDLVILLDYSLDEKKIDSKYSYEKEESLTAKFERDYNFKLIDPEITNPVKEDIPLNFSFKNEAFSYKDFEKIEIDGKFYSITKDENTNIYTVTEPIIKCQEKGMCKIHITSLMLTTENDEEKIIPCDEEVEYLYLKDAPMINSFTASYDSSSISGTYQIEDLDKTIQKGILMMEGPSGKETLELEPLDLTTGTFRKEFQFKKSGDYKVTLQVLYDLGDGKLLTKEFESAETIHQDVQANITSVQVLEGKVERGGTATLTMVIDSNTNETLQSVTIDGEEYPVTFKNGSYEVQNVKVPLEGEGLTRTVFITKLKYSNDVLLNHSVTLELLKKKPTLETLTLQIVDGLIVGNFDYQDEENAIVGAKYTIDGETIELNEEWKEKKFTDTKKRMENTYSVQLSLVYDLGNGVLSDDVTISNNVTVPLEAEIHSVSIPEFSEKGKNITITYTISDNTSDLVSKIKVNEVEYPLTHVENDIYTVTIPISLSEASGNKKFIVTEIIYSEEKKVSVNHETSTTVLKSMPTLGEFTAEYSDEFNTLTGNIPITDLDEAIVKGLLTITGPNFNEVKEVSAEDLRTSTFTTQMDLAYTGEYTLSLVVVYNLGNQEQSFEPKETTISVDLKVTNVEIESPQVVEKNQPIELLYTIQDNQYKKDLKVTHITINGSKKEASYDEETGKYKVILDGVATFGNQAYSTTSLTYETLKEDVDIQSLGKTTNVYVLKTKPVVEKPTFTETEAHVEVTDDDEAIQKIQITFTKEEEPFSETTLDITSKTANIESIENGLYKVTVTTEYDLDAENEFVGSTNTETQTYENVQIVTDYHAEIQNLILQSITEDEAILEFEIKNDTGIDITNVKVVDKDGTEYETTFNSLNGKFTASIENPKTRKELTIGKVTFETKVTKEVEKTDYILINKTKPTVTINSEIIERKVKATISKTDPDNTIEDETYYAVLKNMETLTEEKILIQSEPIQFETILDGGTEYRVEVQATYELVDGKTHENEVLATSHELMIEPEITFVRSYVTNPYAHPASNDFTIHFEFNSNVKLNNIMKTIKVQTTEYEGDSYVKVGDIDDTGVDYSLMCKNSTVQTEGNYQNDCTISYKVPKKSSVIKVKALSYTFNDKKNKQDKTVEISSAEEQLVDVLKWGPNPTYHAKNYYDEGKIELNISFSDVSMLEPFEGKTYFKLSYGTLANKDIQIEKLEANQNYVMTLENIPLKPNGIRLILKARYNPYHGIIHPETEKTEEITIISPIHFFHSSEKITLNNIELVNENGNDFSEKVTEGDPARLSFEFDGEVSFVPTEVAITLDDQAEEKYTLNSNGKGGYITTEHLKGLTKGSHTLKIVKLSNKNNEYQVKENNEISFVVDDKLQVTSTLNPISKTPVAQNAFAKDPNEKQEISVDSSKKQEELKEVSSPLNEEENREEIVSSNNQNLKSKEEDLEVVISDEKKKCIEESNEVQSEEKPE